MTANQHTPALYTAAEAAESLKVTRSEQRTSAGPWLLQVQKAAGGSWHLVATFSGTRETERQLKDGQNVPRYCPDCVPSPRTEMPGVDPVKADRRRDLRYGRAASPKTEGAAHDPQNSPCFCPSCSRSVGPAHVVVKADGRTPNLPAVPAREPPSPAVRGEKLPVTKHGFQDATTDEPDDLGLAYIRKWNADARARAAQIAQPAPEAGS